jgi:hypothetical protein
MGYSERSLRRLVDKIQDGSFDREVHLLNGDRLRNHISNSAEQRVDNENMDDNEVYNTILTQDDCNDYTPPVQLEETDDAEFENCMIDQLGDTFGRQNIPSQSLNDERTDNDFSIAEICTYELILFLDDAKAPRNCYDRLIALLKRQHKMGFSISDAIGRDTFLKSLKKKFKSPDISSVTVGKSPVFKFPFVHMLQNLLDVVGPDLHLINPNAITPSASSDELWNTRWMINTFRYGHRDFLMERDVMLPIIIYMDKTGTDAYQRYSLEPVIFSLGNIPREKRDSRRSWRHMGFVPSNKHIEKSLPRLQFYHNCLEVILHELKVAQKEHPTVRIKQPGGHVAELQARLPVVVVMGDQLSQDTLCARLKVNAGGASRIHRSCMCSYLSVDDPSMTCVSVSKHTLDKMTRLALLSDAQISDITDGNRVEEDYFKKLRQMNQRFLAKPYGTYPVHNAFQGVDFGGWTEGIYEATLDDFMHSTELGVIKTLNEVVFQGLTKSECTEVEYLMRAFMGGVRSSVRSTYPRWRLSEGFSRQKLMTSTERVGTLFSICLALQSHEIQNLISDAHARQRKKYVTMSGNVTTQSDAGTSRSNHESQATNDVEDDNPETDHSDDDISDHVDDDSFVHDMNEHQEISSAGIIGGNQLQDDKFFFERHLQHNISPEQIRHALEHAMRHGFDLEQVKSFDLLQMQCNR